MSIGNHAFVALSSALMTAQFLTATQARGWVVRLMDREPIVFFSCLLGTVGCGMCVVVPPVRKALGMSTSQMDGAPDAKGHWRLCGDNRRVGLEEDGRGWRTPRSLSPR